MHNSRTTDLESGSKSWEIVYNTDDTYNKCKMVYNKILNRVYLIAGRKTSTANTTTIFKITKYFPKNIISSYTTVINDNGTCQVGCYRLHTDGSVQLIALESNQNIRGGFGVIEYTPGGN